MEQDTHNTQSTRHLEHADHPETSAREHWYDKSYKFFLLVPMAMLAFSIIYLALFYHSSGDFINKDVTLTGGTIVTVFDGSLDSTVIRGKLIGEFPDLDVRSISDITTGKHLGIIISTKADSGQIKTAVESIVGYNLTSDNSSVEFSGAALSGQFYAQLMSAIVSAFLLMAWVVFLIFSDSRKMKGIATTVTAAGVYLALYEVSWVRNLAIIALFVGAALAIFTKHSTKNERIIFAVGAVALAAILYIYPSKLLILAAAAALVAIYITSSIPSFAVILSAFADIIMTITTVDLLGMRVSNAGIIAFLMLIGYSVDTDILLTSRLLKNREGSVNQRLWGAFKTGITMTLTSIAAVSVSLALTYSLSDTLRQIFSIILIGLFFDIFNTWLTNASMLKWYMGVKKLA